MVRSAMAAGGSGGGKDQPLAAGAIDDDALWAPPVDPAELHLLDIVVSLSMLDYCHRQFPFRVSKLPMATLSESPSATPFPNGHLAPRRLRSLMVARKR